MRYQLMQIVQGAETVLLDTDSRKEIRNHYFLRNCTRIRVDGRVLPIFEADAWVAGKRIPRPKQKTEKNYGPRPVEMVDEAGHVLKWYETLRAAMLESGYTTCYSVRQACESGKPTSNGKMYRWAS